MSTPSQGTHRSRYAEKRRGTAGPNSMHAIAELGGDGVWRVNGQPYRSPRRVRYDGRDAAGADVWITEAGERVKSL